MVNFLKQGSRRLQQRGNQLQPGDREITCEARSTLGLDISESAVFKVLKTAGFIQ